MIKVALVGAVNSTFATLRKLVEHKINLICVLGYEPKPTEIISGYADLEGFCLENDIPFKSFSKINSNENIQYLAEFAPDVLFVVGLSQLVSSDVLNIPKLGCIGFHPTLLPKGRGRAPIAWLVLEESMGAANFFLMSNGVDDGPLFVQQPFKVDLDDDAGTIEKKIISSIDLALDNWLPDLKRGLWNPVNQDEAKATYFEKRTPEDGWIDWTSTNTMIDRIVKASAFPHPGAFTFFNDKMISINRCRIEIDIKIRGVVGRILRVNTKNECLMQCGEGVLWVSELKDENGQDFIGKVGQRLGYYSEKEIYLLKKEIKEIKKTLENR